MNHRLYTARWLLPALALTGPLLAQKHPAPGDPQRTIQVFDVRDLVQDPQAAGATPPAGTSKLPVLDEVPILGKLFGNSGKTLPKDSGFTAGKPSGDQLVRFVNGFLEPRLVDGEDVKLLGKGNLLALATPDKLAWITRFLHRNRQPDQGLITVTTRFLIVPAAVFAKSVKPLLDGSDRLVRTGPSEPQRPDGATGEQPPPVNKYAMLASEQARERFLLQLVRQSGVELLIAPRLSTVPLSQARLLIAKKIGYVKDFEVEVRNNGFVADPVVDTVTDGLSFDCTVARLSATDIGMDFAFTLSKVKRPIREVTSTLGGKSLTLQLPELTLVQLASRVELARGQTALFAVEAPENQYVLALLRTAWTPNKGK